MFAVLVLAGSAVGFLVRAFTPGFDSGLLQWAAARRSPGLTLAFTVLSDLGSFPIVAPLAAAILLLRRWRRPEDDVVLVVVALGSAALPSVIKLIVQRARPPLGHAHLQSLSFPSEHTVQAAAIYGGIALLLFRGASPRWRALAVALAVAIALAVGASRVYLGLHYPTDVLAGLALGWVWLWWVQGWAHRPLGEDLKEPKPGRGVLT